MAPGSRLLTFAAQWFDDATVARVFEPLIADYQREWADAAPAQRAWIRLSGVSAIAITFATMFSRTLVLAPMPPAITRRVLARLIIFTSVASALLMVPFVVQMREMPMPQFAAAAVSLLPSSVLLAFPFAMPWVADGIRRRGRATPVERVVALRVAIFAVALAILTIGWVVPLSNQQFRNIAAPQSSRPPALGARELTITQLLSEPTPVVADARYAGNSSRRAVRRELHNRLVIALLPALLLWMRWTALARPGSRWFVRLPVAAETALVIGIFFTLYLASVWIEPALGLDAGTGFWTPLIVLLLIGALRHGRSRREDIAAA